MGWRSKADSGDLVVAINQNKRLDIDELRQLFVIDQNSGDVFWRERGMGRHIGKPAGGLLDSGYRKIGLRRDGLYVQFYAHQVAWALCNGAWPQKAIDHINGSKSDNRISNLREADNRQNRVNSGVYAKNKSGKKWVCLHKTSVERGSTKPWQASVWFGKERRQKYFENPDEAHLWASIVAKELHGEFYRPA